MSTSPRNLPRFLPTLTEVVEPGSVNLAVPQVASQTVALEPAPVHIDPVALEARLREEAAIFLDAQIDDQVRIFSMRLRQQLQPIVNEVILEAIVACSESDQRGPQ